MKTLLLISHAPSPNTRAIREAMVTSIGEQVEEGFHLVVKAPLDARKADVLACDGLLLQTTENIGYMAGLTKDFFDRTYNELLEQKEGLPVATVIRAGLDGTGTKRALSAIYSGLGWRTVQEALVLKGPWQDAFAEDAAALAAGFAVGLEAGIY